MEQRSLFNRLSQSWDLHMLKNSANGRSTYGCSLHLSILRISFMEFAVLDIPCYGHGQR